MTDPTVHGSCLCGEVRFSARLPTKWVAHCHCTYCRRAHGAAFVTWAGFQSDRVEIDPTGLQPAWHESSPGARRGFCPRCGSPMLFTSTRWPGEVHVARALITQALDKEPSAHVFFDTHVPWLEVNDALPKKVPQGESAPSPDPAVMLQLATAARAVRAHAHAPYSHFAVGAALLDEQGRVHAGCNVENAAYPQSLCAEAAALARLVSSGARRVLACVVVGEAPSAVTPCGGCRQKLREFAADDAPVWSADAHTFTARHRLADLLPASFGPVHLDTSTHDRTA